MASGNRNLGIELFRIVCMFAICMQHAVNFSNTGAKGFEGRFWNFGVVGFALITGYYGVTFNVRRIVKLWLTAGTCAAVAGFAGTKLGLGGVFQSPLQQLVSKRIYGTCIAVAAAECIAG